MVPGSIPTQGSTTERSLRPARELSDCSLSRPLLRGMEVAYQLYSKLPEVRRAIGFEILLLQSKYLQKKRCRAILEG